MDINPELLAAYQNTTYVVTQPYLEIAIGEFHGDLDEFLIDNNAYTWAFVSAYNPFSKLCSLEQNEENHQKLWEWLQQQNYTLCEGEGRGKDGKWPPEKSFLILDIALTAAKKLGKQFCQNAIVFGSVNQQAELVLL